MAICGNLSQLSGPSLRPERIPSKSGVLRCCSRSASQGEKTSTTRLFVFGLGYTGRAIAKLSLEKGWQVAGTCRSLEGTRKMFQYEGIEAFHFDPNVGLALSAQAVDALYSSTHILSCVPPVGDTNRDPVLANVGSELQSCASVSGLAHWVGYLSSTGVYGDWQGGWVDEGSELRATKGKGYARSVAEAAWMQLWQDHKVPVHIFRLGGIYGPGRSALDAAALQPDQESRSQRRRALQRFTARCHVYDICQALVASMERPRPGAVYNVVDDDPANRAEVLAYAEQLLRGGAVDAHCQSLAPANLRPLRPQLEEKRVRNELLKRELGVQLAFPSYKEGLTAIHSGGMRARELF